MGNALHAPGFGLARRVPGGEIIRLFFPPPVTRRSFPSDFVSRETVRTTQTLWLCFFIDYFVSRAITNPTMKARPTPIIQ